MTGQERVRRQADQAYLNALARVRIRRAKEMEKIRRRRQNNQGIQCFAA